MSPWPVTSVKGGCGAIEAAIAPAEVFEVVVVAAVLLSTTSSNQVPQEADSHMPMAESELQLTVVMYSSTSATTAPQPNPPGGVSCFSVSTLDILLYIPVFLSTLFGYSIHTLKSSFAEMTTTTAFTLAGILTEKFKYSHINISTHKQTTTTTKKRK